MKEIRVDNFIEFCSLIETLPNGTMYRGVRKSSFELVPSLARASVDHRPIAELESILLNRFRNESLPFLSRRPANDFELLTIAQHHGLPTRLLDWSRAPFVALYFAVERIVDDGDSAVYVLPLGTTSMIDRIDGVVPLDAVKEVVLYPPLHISPRVAAQSAFFTLHPTPFAPWRPEQLVKVVIPGNAKEALLNTLGKAGIKASTLFPDLDGLCRTLRHEYGYWS
jgi:hypothetical protein